MGLTLKSDKVFHSPYGDEPSAYANIKDFAEFSAKKKYAEIIVDVYKSKELKTVIEPYKNSPRFMIGMNKEGEKEPEVFDEYLSDSALKQNGETIYEAAYRFITEKNLLPDWEGDQV